MADEKSLGIQPPHIPKPAAALDRLDALLGTWRTETHHEAFPVIYGRVTFEWLAGAKFLVLRSTVEHPDFPDSLSVIGCDAAHDACIMRYFDSRGVYREYALSIADGVLTLWRDEPGFSQRFHATLSEDGQTMQAAWEKSPDGQTWHHDFSMTYTREASGALPADD